ncbi:BTAD domain-containing putative transcriptional regulator [Salsipaludibacter albus]|uniref:nSTAND1 domain-containing NTPase n=1 Tax=Salsipaludibacter albus TaxID=2849650 RepID=UPI001EE490D1|nr:BTAD domain-containing putative transcriptional regulator [Salsipaludibacter albus]MBY5163475.1 AAA family ATPase [Salsipaludibacter albus]
MPDLDVTLAGAVSLRRGDRRVGERAFGARQLRLVTAMLVLERDGPVSMDLLADQLWPDQPPTQWRVAVRGLVSQFRRRLVDLGMGSDSVVGDQGRYVLDLGEVRVDLETAAHDVADGRRAVDAGAIERASLLAGSARSVLSRPVLSGVESEWLDRLRDRVARDHLESLVLLGECRRRLGAPADARRVLAEAIGIDPLREDAWRALMRAEAAAGNVARALAAYEDCRRRLADELGVDPAEETQRLHAELLQGVPDPDVLPFARPPKTDHSVAIASRDLVPYVGLRSFTTAEADRFFGRDAEVQALVDRLARHGIVAVVGPSGVGKSSLVRAGLLPALDRGAIPDADTWLPVVMTPTAAPAKALWAELAEARPGVDEGVVREAVVGSEDGLHDAAGLVLADAPSTARVLLVVDQFEELFTLGTADRAEAFVGLLTAATARLDRRVVVVVTLRADFYDRAADVAGMADLLSHSQFVVPPLEGDQVEAAIVGPARHVGVSLEPGLLGRIVADVAGEPGSLPLLQHLLYELWEHRVDRVLTRGAYDDLGGVTGALAHRAEQVHLGLEREERAVARRILLRAVQPGEEGGDARRPVPEDELYGPGDDPEQVDGVVHRLVDARLLTAGQETPGEGRTFELAHEALIAAWPRLRGWVDEARGWLLDHRRLTFAAQEWVTHDRQDDWLLGGTPLDEAHALVLADGRGDVDLHLSPAEHELVQASLDARDLVRTWEAERQQRRRDLERRSLRRLQALLAVVAVTALTAVALWWDARSDSRVAVVRELVTAANDNVSSDPQRSLLLALEAADRVRPGDALAVSVEDSLHRAITRSRMLGFVAGTGPVMSYSPSADLLATMREEPDGDGWSVDLRDAATGDVRDTLSGHGGTGPVWDGEFSTDGSVVAVGDRAGRLTLWDTATARPSETLERPGTLPTPQSFSPDLDLLAITWARTEEDADVEVLSLDPLQVHHVVADIELVPTESNEDAPGTVTVSAGGAWFSPDGSRIAVTYPSIAAARGAAAVRVLDTSTWETVLELDVDAREAAWSPDGALLALTGWTGSVVVDSSTGEVVHGLLGNSRDDEFLSWNVDSTRLASGRGLVWDMVDRDAEPIRLTGSATGRWVRFTDDPDVVVSTDHEDVATFEVSRPGRGEVTTLPADGWTSGLDWTPDGRSLVVSAGEGTIASWEVSDWSLGEVVQAHQPGAFDPDAEDTPEEEPEWPAVLYVDVSDDGSTLTTAGFDDVAVWDADDLDERHRIETGGGWEPSTVSPDGSHVATVDNASDAIVVVDADGEVVSRMPQRQDVMVENLRFSPDGTTLASTMAPATQALGSSTLRAVNLWDWRTGDLLEAIEASPMSVDFSPDGRHIAVAGLGLGVWDRHVGDWDLEILDDTEFVNDVDWLPDGSRVATCAFGERLGGGQVQVWDARTGDELLRLHDDITGYCRVRVSPDGRHVAVSDGAPTSSVFVWTMDHDEVVDIARSRLVRSWTLEECQQYLRTDTCPA